MYPGGPLLAGAVAPYSVPWRPLNYSYLEHYQSPVGPLIVFPGGPLHTAVWCTCLGPGVEFLIVFPGGPLHAAVWCAHLGLGAPA